MYAIEKTFDVEIAHCLRLPYESKCTRYHGHSLTISVRMESATLTDYGMVMDFTVIKDTIETRLDHQDLNMLELEFENQQRNTTSENLAEWIYYELVHVGKLQDNAPRPKWVRVQETKGNIAEYWED